MAELKRTRIPMPWAGMNTVSPPGQAPDGKAPLVRNFLCHFPGKLTMRGPIDGKVFDQNLPSFLGEVLYPNQIIAGVWTFNSNILYGVNGPSLNSVPFWKAPYIKQTESFGLDFGQTKAMLLETDKNVAESINLESVNIVPSGVSARIEEFAYGFGIASSETFSNLNGGIEVERRLMKWTGAAAKPVEFANSPRSGQYIKTYLNTLWILGGQSPEITTAFFTVPPEVALATKAANSILKFNGIVNSYFTVGKAIRAVKGTIPAGATILEVTLESRPVGSVPAWRTAVKISKEITTTAVGPVEVERTIRKPEPNTLFYVTPGVAIKDELATWKSPTTGLVNRIVVGDEDRSDFGVAIAVVGSSMVIFKRHSVWALYGQNPETFQVKNLTKEFGCVDPWSVCETNFGVYFMSQSGLQYFNGENFSRVDGEIETIINPLVNEVAGEAADQKWGEYWGRISVTDVGNGYLGLCIAKQKQGVEYGKPVGPTFFGLMHMASGNWVEVTTNNSASRFPVLIGKTSQYPWFFEGEWITDLNSITATNEDINADTQHTIKVPIEAKVTLDKTALSAPGFISQIHRLMQDYSWPNGANDAAAQPGWWWKMTDGDGTVIQEQIQLPGHGFTTSKYLRGRRWENDNFNEIVDGTIEIEWKNPALEEEINPHSPELYDATVEFSVARQRQST